MAMTCPEANVFQGLLDGTLPEATQTTLSEHLAECARCRKELDKLATSGKSFSKLAQHLKQPGADPEPGLQRILQDATSDLDPQTALGEAAGAGGLDLSFLTPSAKPEHLGRLGHYEVLRVIGKGGFGVVLKGFDERLHRMVAIKVLAAAYAENGSARKRFIREARAAAAVKNEHVVGIYDVQEEAQPPYLVMELIDGISLQDKLDRHGPLGVKEILRIGLQTAEGLTAAHKQGLVHRDIKPANILLENGVERVKITDFGLARAVDDASVTQSGTVAGTPMYMSPEQAQGLAIDHRSDLFSLGTVLYAMCTGHAPFRATGTLAVLMRVVESTPRPIREINPEIPDWLADVIAKLHAKKPEDRFQTAQEVAKLLSEYLAHVQQPSQTPRPAAIEVPASSSASSRGSGVRRWARRGVAIALIAALAWLLDPYLLLFLRNTGYLWISRFGNGVDRLELVLSRDGKVEKEYKGMGFVGADLPPGSYVLKAVNMEPGTFCRFELQFSALFSRRGESKDDDHVTFEVSRGEHVKIEVKPSPFQNDRVEIIGAPPVAAQNVVVLPPLQESSSPPPLPKLPGEILKFFVGAWKMEAVFDEPKLPAGLVAQASGMQSFELLDAGNFLRGYDTETKGQFEILTLQAWFPEEQQLQSWTFNSRGDMNGPAVGKWDAGKHILLWKETIGDVRATREYTFVTGNDVKVHHVHKDKADKIVYEARQTMTRLAKTPDIARIAPDPKRPAAMKVLDRITGDWRNFGTVKSADKPNETNTTTALLQARSVLGGRMIECHETGDFDGGKSYWLAGYDARLKKYRFWHFHSLSGATEIDGVHDDAKKTLTWKSTNNSHNGRWVFKSDDERDFEFSVQDPKTHFVFFEIKGVARRSKPKPFVLRGNDAAEHYFDDLGQAVASAAAGDTVEIHGNGPFVSSLFRVKKPLTIRAAKGYRPVVTFQHEPLDKFWIPMVDVQAPLVMEGIELRYTRPADKGVVLLVQVASDLRMTHCRVVAQGDANAFALMYGSAQFDRCEILTDRWSCFRWNYDGATKITLSDSLVIGPEAFTLHANLQRDKIHDLDIRMSRCTIIGGRAMMSWLVDQVLPTVEVKKKPIRVHATECVFSLSNNDQRLLRFDGNVAGEYQDVNKVRSLIEQTMSWTEDNNLYPERFLIGLFDYKKGQLLPNGSLCTNLQEWYAFWGITPTKSIQGTARFQVVDIMARLSAGIHQIAATDCRLASGSPGQGVLPGGIDIGADVDRVGAGPPSKMEKKIAAEPSVKK